MISYTGKTSFLKLLIIIFLQKCHLVTSSVLQLGMSVVCATQWSISKMTLLSNYGCFCGYNSESDLKYFTYKNEIDHCCYNHDLCYEYFWKSCGGDEVYDMNYEWKCRHSHAQYNQHTNALKTSGGDVMCKRPDKIIDTEKIEANATILNENCHFEKCLCDKAFADCLAKSKKTPQKDLYKIDRKVACIAKKYRSKAHEIVHDEKMVKQNSVPHQNNTEHLEKIEEFLKKNFTGVSEGIGQEITDDDPTKQPENMPEENDSKSFIFPVLYIAVAGILILALIRGIKNCRLKSREENYEMFNNEY